MLPMFILWASVQISKPIMFLFRWFDLLLGKISILICYYCVQAIVRYLLFVSPLTDRLLQGDDFAKTAYNGFVCTLKSFKSYF